MTLCIHSTTNTTIKLPNTSLIINSRSYQKTWDHDQYLCHGIMTMTKTKITASWKLDIIFRSSKKNGQQILLKSVKIVNIKLAGNVSYCNHTVSSRHITDHRQCTVNESELSLQISTALRVGDGTCTSSESHVSAREVLKYLCHWSYHRGNAQNCLR